MAARNGQVVGPLPPMAEAALPESTPEEPITELPLTGKRAARIAGAYQVYAAAKTQLDTAQLVLEQLVGAALDTEDVDVEAWRGLRQNAEGAWFLRYLTPPSDDAPTVVS